ncbi:MAG: class II aldolase/adducin family protein [Clostridiales bacterium]|nr:class II aldolase/adducin family protein [Clostridiales bacterium]
MNTLQQKYKSQIEELVKTTRRLGKIGYVTSFGGNLSIRADEDVVAITPTKVAKRKMKFDDIVLVNMKGEVLYTAPNRKPTGETSMHLNILNKRPDAKGVIHAHPPILTGFAAAHSQLLARPILPEPIIEVGPILNAEYAEPVSEDLAKTFNPVILKTNAWLMNNHGITICNCEGIGRTLELLEMLEALAQSVVVALACGKVEEIPKDEVKKLENTIISRGLPLPGLPGYNKSLCTLYFDD